MAERTMVEMTPEEKAQFEAFQRQQERKAQMESKREQRKQLQAMTDEVMAEAVAELQECHDRLVATKKKVIDTFSTLMEFRKEVNEESGKKEQYSFSFTSADGLQRLKIGYNMNDNYLMQVEDGIKKVREYLQSLAKDEQSGRLVDAVMKLLSRDQKGNLKASRVLQLSKMAEESGSDAFKEGMAIIREAYRPTPGKTYIRCQVKTTVEKDGEKSQEWTDVGLSMSEV